MPKNKKDQFVIAYLADLVGSTPVVDYARALSSFLKKGLILLFVCDNKYTKLSPTEAQSHLITIKNRYPDEDISFCALKGKTREVISLLPTALGGVVVVAGVNKKASPLKPTNPRRVMHDFGLCRTAYLTVQLSRHPDPHCELDPQSPHPSINLRDVAFRIDYNRESKEKLIWASYFARFNGSRLHVLHEQYNDSGLRAKLDNNMRFLDKFFASLKVGYETEIMPSVANFPDREAAKQASQKGYGLLVCLTTDTRELDVVDWFIGVQETRVVKNKQQLPVLFINPRDDLYVLCD